MLSTLPGKNLKAMVGRVEIIQGHQCEEFLRQKRHFEVDIFMLERNEGSTVWGKGVMD